MALGGGGPRHFNPYIDGDAATAQVLQALYATLFSYDNQAQATRPDLAKTWKESADGRRWTVGLRQAWFSDGTPIAARDVVASFRCVLDSSRECPLRSLLEAGGSALELDARDDSTVVFHLAARSVIFRDAVGSVPILPGVILEKLRAEGRLASAFNLSTAPGDLVCSGPWRLNQFVPGEKIVFGRNPYSHYQDVRGTRLPYLDQMTWTFPGNQDAEILSFKAGELDGLQNPPASARAGLTAGAGRGGYTLSELGNSMNVHFLCFNLNLKPDESTPCVGTVKYAWFADLGFREAVSLGLNQERMIRIAFQGRAEANGALYTRGYRRWHDDRIAPPRWNPVRSRALLARRGFKDRDGDGVIEDHSGHPVRFTLLGRAGSPEIEALSTLVQSDLKSLGMDVLVALVDRSLLTTRLRSTREFDVALSLLSAPVPPDPSQSSEFWRSEGSVHLWHSSQKRPASAWEAAIDSISRRLDVAPDQAERKALCDSMQEILAGQRVILFLPVSEEYVAVRDRIGNWKPSLLRPQLVWNSQELFVRH